MKGSFLFKILCTVLLTCLVARVRSDDWNVRVDDILSDDLVLTYPEGIDLENEVLRQSDEDLDFTTLPVGITYCQPRNGRGSTPTYCPARTIGVTDGTAVYDILQDPSTEIIETFVFYVKFPEDVTNEILEPEVSVNNSELVDANEVLVEEFPDIVSDGARILNFTLTVPVKNTSVGIVDVDMRVRDSQGELLYTSTWRLHVLGIVLKSRVQGPGTLVGDMLVVDSYRDLITEEGEGGVTIVYETEFFTRSATSGGNDPTLRDVKLEFFDNTDWNQVTFEDGCEVDTAVVGDSGTVTLPDPNCGMGFTEDGTRFAMRFNPNRVGDQGIVDVQITVDGLTTNSNPRESTSTHSVTVISDWKEAPVVLTSINFNTPFEHYGGSQVEVTGYNLPTTEIFAYDMSLTDPETNERLQGFELVSQRETLKSDFQQKLVYAVPIGPEGNSDEMQLNFFKQFDSERREFFVPDGASREGTYNLRDPPPNALRPDNVTYGVVSARYFIRSLAVWQYYERPLTFIRRFAELGNKEANVDAFTLAVAPGVLALSSRLAKRGELQSSVRQEVSGVAVDFEYYTPEGTEEELRSVIEINIGNNNFENELGYELDVDNIVFTAPTVARTTNRAIEGLILGSVAAVMAFSISGQTATVVVAAEVVATSSSQVIPSALNIASTSSVNTVMKVITPVQLLSARGLINVNNRDPFTAVAAKSSGYMLRIPLPWERSTSAGSSGQVISTMIGRKPLCVSCFYEALGDTSFVAVFKGQIFYIGLSVCIALTLHTILHFALKKRKRAHRICMRILTKMEAMFLNLLHLGIFIGVAEILRNRNQVDVYLVLAAILVLFVFGLGYPALVIVIVFRQVRPRMNAEWMKNYWQRFLLWPSWSCFDRWKGSTELESMELAWQQDNINGQQRKFAYVVRKHSRYSGRWQSEGPNDNTTAMFGTFFMAYKGQFYAYFVIELFILALEGTFIGALGGEGQGKIQAILVLVLECISLLLLTWLLPFNDWLENLIAWVGACLNVSIASIQVVLANNFLSENRYVELSRIMLFLNMAVIALAILFVAFTLFEALIYSWSSIVKCCTNMMTCSGEDEKDKDSESLDSYYYNPASDKKPAYALYYVERDRTEMTDAEGPQVTYAHVERPVAGGPIQAVDRDAGQPYVLHTR